MKTQDPHQELQDGFELAPPPPIGPDGTPQIPPQRAGPPARPSLCQAGPCRRYHRLVVQVDAEQPGAVRLPIVLPEGTPGAQQTPKGTVYRAPAAFYAQTHHYCYPDTGIEMPLGALPVVECNRWEPRGAPSRREDWVNVEAWFQSTLFESASGRKYLADVAAWESARAAEALEAAEAERLIAQSMAETPTIACQVCGNRFEEHELDVQMRCRSCVGANLQPRSTAPSRSSAPHRFVLGKFKRGDRGGQTPEETCDVCGYDPRNSIHHTETP